MTEDRPTNPDDETLAAFHGQSANMRYRCSCGTEFEVLSEQSICPACQQRVPSALISDPTMTLSFCSLTTENGSGSVNGSLGMGSDASGRVTLGESRKSNATVNRSGQRLGHFVLQEPLGTGGMGAVYRALDTSLQRYVAVKVLREGSSDGSDSGNLRQTDRLRREAVAQARLNHPRVVTIYYVGRAGEEPFLAMELLPGPTLQQRLTQGPIPYQELIAYALQTTDALEAADQSGLVHGDIKPSNLLMAGPGNIKLSDFGLARRSGSNDGDGSVSGTPNYLAPELIDGAAPDRRADMYALGVTLFELAFGRRPYQLQGTTLEQRLLTHRSAEIEFPERWPDEVPESFRQLLERLLAKDPDDRFKDYSELRSCLFDVAPVGTTPAGRVARGIAWVVDITCLAILQAPFLIPKVIVQISESAPGDGDWMLEQSGGLVSIVMVSFVTGVLAIFGSLAIPILSLWWDLKRWRTPGRYLMQLRVVDRHGLPPSRRSLILRNVLRYFTFWSSVIFALPITLGYFWAGMLDDLIGLAWWLVDAIFLLLPARMALHDRICRTHVVLDERTSQQRRQSQQ